MATASNITRITPQSSPLYFHILHDEKDNAFLLEDWFGNQMFHGKCIFSLNVCKAIQIAASLFDDRAMDDYLRPYENQSKVQELAVKLRKLEKKGSSAKELETTAIDFFDRVIK